MLRYSACFTPQQDTQTQVSTSYSSGNEQPALQTQSSRSTETLLLLLTTVNCIIFTYFVTRSPLLCCEKYDWGLMVYQKTLSKCESFRKLFLVQLCSLSYVIGSRSIKAQHVTGSATDMQGEYAKYTVGCSFYILIEAGLCRPVISVSQVLEKQRGLSQSC